MKRLILKILIIHSINKSSEISKFITSKKLSPTLMDKLYKYIEFDFIKCISKVLPLLFLGYTFLIMQPINMLPIIIFYEVQDKLKEMKSFLGHFNKLKKKKLTLFSYEKYFRDF